jgi:phospholipase C
MAQRRGKTVEDGLDVAMAMTLALFCMVGADASAATITDAQHHIKHIIIIMQENRSFDSYFGTFPGADGLPTDAQGQFTTCVPLDVADRDRGCVKPFHDTSFVQGGGPHGAPDFVFDRDNGKMDGFVQRQIVARRFCEEIQNFGNPQCIGAQRHDTMGYHTDAEIPNYWPYAKTYMLQDHLYESVSSYSLPSHLMMVSEWSARCKSANPMSCATDLNPPRKKSDTLPYSWTALTWLLDLYDVPWKYYLSEGGTPDCDDQNADDVCDPEIQSAAVSTFWNPLPRFVDFAQKVKINPKYADHLSKVDELYKAVGKLARCLR